jgi:hypothetical protein
VVNGSGGGGGGGGGGGEANTASNAGAGGVGPFLQKNGVDLEFKSINAASNRISVANDAVNREVDIDVAPANLDLAQLGGALGASQIAAASKQGSGARLVTFGGGALEVNDCAKFDATGSLVSTGAACGSGGSGDTITADAGIIVTPDGPGVKRVGVDTATVPTFLTATATLDFGSIPSSNCSELTLTLTGAFTGDSVAPGWPQALEAGLTGTMLVSGPGTVTVRLCKVTAGSVDPALQVFRATIVRSF